MISIIGSADDRSLRSAPEETGNQWLIIGCRGRDFGENSANKWLIRALNYGSSWISLLCYMSLEVISLSTNRLEAGAIVLGPRGRGGRRSSRQLHNPKVPRAGAFGGPSGRFGRPLIAVYTRAHD